MFLPRFFPADEKKLKERIRRYRRALEKDESDNYGKRYLVGPMYLLLSDVDGALEYYDWYRHTYQDDSGEPFNHLCWSLALFKAGRASEAALRMRQTLFSNLYLIPYLLGIAQNPLQIWHGSNMAELDYAIETPPELLALWDEKSRAWAKSVYENPELTRDRERFIEIEGELLKVRPGPRRTALVHESFRIAEGRPSLRIV